MPCRHKQVSPDFFVLDTLSRYNKTTIVKANVLIGGRRAGRGRLGREGRRTFSCKENIHGPTKRITGHETSQINDKEEKEDPARGTSETRDLSLLYRISV